MSTRRKFTEYEKRIVYANGGGKCSICGKPVSFKKMTIDHKIPLASGGTNSIDNLQLACLSCNQMKGSMDMEEFIGKIQQLYKRYKWMKIRNIFARGNAQ